MPELRQRKPTEVAAPAAKAEEPEKAKTKPLEPDLEPNIFVLSGLFVVFTLVVGSFLFYKVDNTSHGPFAAWVNQKFPAVERALNRPGGFQPFGANAEAVPAGIKLTEEELKAFDGTDPEQPIYLAINGTIYDVSAAASFYGPGGHYHHFVGKDASRAWVSECWDSEDQLTWRMDGVEEMFRPKYLDETLEDVNQGKWDPSDDTVEFPLPKAAMTMMAKKAMERFGSVTDGEKARRRAEDKEEAETAVSEALAKWVKFFSGNGKYQAVGEVILDENRPAPPPLCEAALKKRPLKGGKLAALMADMDKVKNMDATGSAGSDGSDNDDDEDNFPAGMPESVKAQIRKDRAARKAEAVEEVYLSKDDDESAAKAPHDEL